MNTDLLLKNFATVVQSADAVPALRRYILNMAVRGQLTRQNPKDEPATTLLKKHKPSKPLPPLNNSEKPFKIPAAWKWVRLMDIADVIMGQSPVSEHYNRQRTGHPFYQGKTDFGKRHPTPRVWCAYPKKIAQPGDILISVRVPIGPTNLADQTCGIGRGLSALRPYKSVGVNFLLHCLRGLEEKMAEKGVGSTFTAINKDKLSEFLIPLPPLAEQKRITAKVDELTALCDKLEAALINQEENRRHLLNTLLATN